MYTGNRWNFETEFNRFRMAVCLSQSSPALCKERADTERTVDSYRKINKTSKGRKPYKDDSFCGDIERRKICLHLCIHPHPVDLKRKR